MNNLDSTVNYIARNLQSSGAILLPDAFLILDSTYSHAA